MLRRFLFRVGVLWLGLALSATAQPPRENPATSAPASSSGAAVIRESKIGPFFVRNAKGELIVDPSLTFEELERLRQATLQQQGPAPPRFALLPVTKITGIASDTVADLEVVVRLKLLKSAGASNSTADWVRVPLRLNQAILLPPTKHDGPGEVIFESIPGGDGYVVWLFAAADTEHQLTLKLRVPLLNRAGERQLVLATPNVENQVQLKLPIGAAQPRVTPGSGYLLSQVTATKPHAVTVDGAGGELSLSWREQEELPPILSTLGNISATLVGRRWELDAQITVSGLGQPIDSFTVRLPPGMKWIGSQATQSGLSYAPLSSTGTNQVAGALIQVRRVDGKTISPIEARIRCESSDLVIDTQTPVELGGFEVLAARHQRGTMDFHAEGNWAVTWQPDDNSRRIDDVPELLRQQKIAARFEFDRQPFSLKALVRAQETRVAVEPTWLVMLKAKQLQLDGALKYRLSGARAKQVEFDMAGWTVDRLGPSEFIEKSWRIEGEHLVVPLSANAQSGAGEFELQLQAHRSIPSRHTEETSSLGGSGLGAFLHPFVVAPLLGQTWLERSRRFEERELTIDLPRPGAAAESQGLLIILPDDNLELTPNPDLTQGLVLDALPTTITLPTSQQTPLVYREDGSGQTALFAGRFRLRPQAITATVETLIRWEALATVLEQRFDVAIANEPTRVLQFAVAMDESDDDRWEVLVDGNPDTLVPIETPSSEKSPTVLELRLREPRIGPCQVVVRHRIPRTAAATTTTFQLPLLDVVAGPPIIVTARQLRIAAVPGRKFEVLDPAWTPVLTDNPQAPAGTALYQSKEPATLLALSVTRDTEPETRATTLRRIWVQTLLTGDGSRVRACFRLVTDEPFITLSLPTTVRRNELIVAVNGERARFETTESGVRVDLSSENTAAREFTLEAWYWLPARTGPMRHMELAAPILDGVTHADRIYWELLLPPDEHLVWHDRSLTSESPWEWRPFVWSRQPVQSQSELESWVGATAQSDFERAAMHTFNRYLYSSIGPLGTRPITTATRRVLVFSIAGFVLLVGLLLIYVPALRQPWSLLVVGTLLVASAMAYPEPAMVFGQTVVLGLLLLLVSRIIATWTSRRTATRVVMRSTSVPPPDSRPGKAASRSVDVNSRTTTQTLPPAMPVSATGAEP